MKKDQDLAEFLKKEERERKQKNKGTKGKKEKEEKVKSAGKKEKTERIKKAKPEKPKKENTSLKGANHMKTSLDKKKKIKSIRTQLIFLFCIPLLFISVLGIVCASSASKALQSNYEEAASSTLSANADKFEMVFSTIEIGRAHV